jgi:hypothetical protein
LRSLGKKTGVFDAHETYFFPNTPDGNGWVWDTVQGSFPTYNSSRGTPWLDQATGRWVAAGDPLYSHPGFVMDQLAGDKMARVMSRFLGVYDPNDQLAGIDFAKGPDVQLTAYGLLDMDPAQLQGTSQAKTEAQLRGYADVLVNSFIRDTVLAGEFAEELHDWGNIGDPVMSGGVQPSLFSLTNFVDFVWVANGFRLDEGNLAFTHLSTRQGGVSGLSYLGEPLDVSIDGDTITVTSQALGGEVVLDAAEGETVRIQDVPAPATVDVSAKVSSRCVAGKVTLSVLATNNEDEVPVAVLIGAGAYGSKSFPGVGPHANGLLTANTGLATIQAGSVAVQGQAVGNPATAVNFQVGYAARDCTG